MDDRTVLEPAANIAASFDGTYAGVFFKARDIWLWFSCFLILLLVGQVADLWGFPSISGVQRAAFVVPTCFNFRELKYCSDKHAALAPQCTHCHDGDSGHSRFSHYVLVKRALFSRSEEYMPCPAALVDVSKLLSMLKAQYTALGSFHMCRKVGLFSFSNGWSTLFCTDNVVNATFDGEQGPRHGISYLVSIA